MDSIKNQNVTGDKNGVAEFKIPKGLKSARIWASKEGYVTLYFNWENGELADKIEFKYALNSLLKIDGGVPTPAHAISANQYIAGEQREWQMKMDAGLDPAVSRETHFVKFFNDGSFLINGVQPGKYRFLIKIYEPPTGCLIEPVGYAFLEFSTEDKEVVDNRISLGTIDIQLKTRPKVCETFTDFAYQDLRGKQHLTSEFRGKHVLIDFWASWCQPCIKSMPDIANVHRSIEDRTKAEVVSISLDEDLAAAKKVALKQKVSWQVGVAKFKPGKDSTAAMLGISAVPTYVVLDPKGKILYRGFDLKEAATFLPTAAEEE